MSQGPHLKNIIRLPQTYCTAHPQAIIDVAQAADELGFFGVSVQDHIIADGALSSCAELHQHDGDDRTVYEALQTLAFVSGATKNVKLVTGILVVPFRHAVLLAKETAALDVFSNGRLVVGVGVGAPRRGKVSSDGAQDISVHARVSDKEFDAFKVQGHRGRITDETLQVLDVIWNRESASFQGEYYNFDELEVFPKPIQKPRPPLWIGGRSRAAQERTMRYGDGWIPSQVSAAKIAEERSWMAEFAMKEELKVPEDIGVNVFIAVGSTDEEARETLARGFGDRFNAEGLETLVIYGNPETCARKMQQFIDAGVNIFDLKLVPITVEATIEAMETLRTEILPILQT